MSRRKSRSTESEREVVEPAESATEAAPEVVPPAKMPTLVVLFGATLLVWNLCLLGMAIFTG